MICPVSIDLISGEFQWEENLWIVVLFLKNKHLVAPLPLQHRLRHLLMRRATAR